MAIFAVGTLFGALGVTVVLGVIVAIAAIRTGASSEVRTTYAERQINDLGRDAQLAMIQEMVRRLGESAGRPRK